MTTNANGIPSVLTGIDVLDKSGFTVLKGHRIGLVTNHTGRTYDGRSTIDVLHAAGNVTVAALFGPEHGLRGIQDESVDDDVDASSGLPIYSLYGARTKPTEAQCANLDAFVYDIQDIGCRFYTYLSTLGNVMEAADELSKSVFVLDRPNPITGVAAGPLPDSDRLSFTAYHSIPIRHGLTIGELAKLIHRERGFACPLRVIECEGWKRAMWYDETGLPWVNPSPNMRSLYAALLYPGIGLLEFTNLSVGRGTDRPFELVGAPYLDGLALAQSLNDCRIPGVRGMPIEFKPTSSVFAGERCHGIAFTIADRNVLDPIRLGIELARILIAGYPGRYLSDKLDTLLANRALFERILDSSSYDEISGYWMLGLTEFERRRNNS